MVFVVVFMLNTVVLYLASIYHHWITVDAGKMYCTPIQQMQSHLQL